MSVSTDDARRSTMLAEGLSRADLPSARSLVPMEWHPATSVGLDGVIRIDYGRLTEADIRDRREGSLLGELSAALGGVGELEPETCLDSIEAGHVLGARIERARMHTAGELAARAGMELLRKRGTEDPGELSKTARERWRAQCKSIATLEIQTLTGISRWEARELVAIALAPRAVTRSIRQALEVGLARWVHVVKFWRRCSRLPHEHAAPVARALFATDAPAEELAVERLDVDGVPHTDPWPAKVFAEALEREATRVEATDPEELAARRAAQRAARTAYGIVDDDGTGQVVITGDAASTSACVDRLHILAKKARAEGDQRTESQLRSDIARALLLHGTLPLPGTPDDPGDHAQTSGDPRRVPGIGDESPPGLGNESLPGLDDKTLLTPDELTSLARVLSGMPTYEMQVIVPWDVLTGQPVVPSQGCCAGCSGTCRTVNPAPQTSGERTPGADASPPTASPPTASPPAASPPSFSASQRTQRAEGVGRLLGRFTRFLTAQDLRAMALAPGSRFVRLLTDPADGRCIERTLKRYEPDDRMRQQIHAADVTSRAPGSTTTAKACQLDHVLEFLLGGKTAESNFQSLDEVWHGNKTAKFWAAAIDGTRNVTWSSYFGRIYRTRVHDYRQYLATGLPLPQVPEGRGSRSEHGSDPVAGTGSAPDASIGSVPDAGKRLSTDDRRHLASLLVYAALADRQNGGRLEAYDDDPLSDDEFVDDTQTVIWVRHTRKRDGRKASGRRVGTPTPEEIIARPAEEILDAEHWTDPFTERGQQANGGTKNDPDTGEGWDAEGDVEEPPPF